MHFDILFVPDDPFVEKEIFDLRAVVTLQLDDGSFVFVLFDGTRAFVTGLELLVDLRQVLDCPV